MVQYKVHLKSPQEEGYLANWKAHEEQVNKNSEEMVGEVKSKKKQ